MKKSTSFRRHYLIIELLRKRKYVSFEAFKQYLTNHAIIATIKTPSHYTDESLHDETSNIEIKALLETAMQLAENTLLEHKSFLIELSRILVEKTNIQQDELKQIINKRGLAHFLNKEFSPLEVLLRLPTEHQPELFSVNNICLNYETPSKEK